MVTTSSSHIGKIAADLPVHLEGGAVEAAVHAYQAGRMVIVIDDEDRENEGDLTMAAEFVTPAAINMMSRLARGLICISLTGETLDRLGISQMVPANTSHFDTPFTVSVDARAGVTTGVSAADRAATVGTLIDPQSGPADIMVPGHMFPLRAREGGVFERRGQTEAVVDICRIAGLRSAAVLCEVMDADGTMARLSRLRRLARRLDIPIVSVEQIRRYRLARERVIRRTGESRFPVATNAWEVVAYRTTIDQDEYVALTSGSIANGGLVPVALHTRSSLTSIIGELMNGHTPLHRSAEVIRAEGLGVILCRVPGRPMNHQTRTRETLSQVHRQVLNDLGAESFKLLDVDVGWDGGETVVPVEQSLEFMEWC